MLLQSYLVNIHFEASILYSWIRILEPGRLIFFLVTLYFGALKGLTMVWKTLFRLYLFS